MKRTPDSYIKQTINDNESNTRSFYMRPGNYNSLTLIKPAENYT